MPLKKLLIILLSLFTLQGCSLVNSVSNLRKDFSCDGNFKTMLMQLPTNFNVSNQYLTIKYTGDIEMLQDLEEKYKFDLLHGNGVLVSRINENEISFSAVGVNGTLLLKECELHFPIESELSKNIFQVIPSLVTIFSGL